MANKVLLPNGKQQFCDPNGNPYAGGTVTFYVPATTTPKTTWQDSAGTVPNANPVVLDSAGRASIYGDGDYRQILKDSLGNTIWDQVVSGELASASSGSSSLLIWGGTTGGSANAQTLTVAAFTFDPGQIIVAIPVASSIPNPSDGATYPFTLTVNTIAVNVKVQDLNGLRDPMENEILANVMAMFAWDEVNGWFVLVSRGQHFPLVRQPLTTSIALGQGSADMFFPVSTSGGNVTITLATAVGQVGRKKTFKKITAANTLTIDPNASETIDGQATITLSNQWDYITIVSDGANWYIEASQIGSMNYQLFTNVGANTWTKPTGPGFGVNSLVEVEIWGAGGSGSRDTGTATNRAGGGGGGYTREICRLGVLGSTETVTIGAGGAAVTTNANGNNGGNSTFGVWFTGYGGGGGAAGNGGGGGGARGAAALQTSGTGTGASGDVMFGNANGNSSPGSAGYYSGGTGAGGGGATQAGGNSVYGGGGGGSRTGAGGTSTFGGNGGAAGNGAVNGVAGSQPGGGGGAGDSASNSGAGGAGMCRVWVFGVP